MDVVVSLQLVYPLLLAINYYINLLTMFTSIISVLSTAPVPTATMRDSEISRGITAGGWPIHRISHAPGETPAPVKGGFGTQ